VVERDVPPNSDWMAAPEVADDERERTMMPRTIAEYATTRCARQLESGGDEQGSTAMRRPPLAGGQTARPG
jgi:hypothetical protein